MTNNEFKQQIHKLIPGGAHTYSKGDDQFPTNAPAAISKGKGAWVWDLEGNKFLDCSMGLTSVSLGHAFEPVLEKVREELELGVNFQRPALIEMAAAERFLSAVKIHDMVKFAKNGSTVTTAAVKLARAFTKRKLVAFPSDHPFYSYDDWFIGKSACSAGVPDEVAALSVTYKSCDLTSLKALFEKYPGQIACVISEPPKNFCGDSCGCSYSPAEFLRQSIKLTQDNGALYILDEMVTGFKTGFPGSMALYDVNPDLATWGKGIANGFSFCALTGRREIMELGGINAAGKEKVFLISTTHGAETHALAASIATIDFFENNNVIASNHAKGNYIIKGVRQIIDKYCLSEFIRVSSSPWMPAFIFMNGDGEVDNGYRTLMMQEMISNGVLFQGQILPTWSHNELEIEFFLHAFELSVKTYTKALVTGYEEFLKGEPTRPVFRKII
jgi:glutamate-1-semialdehyde aminotransferase